MKWIEVIRVGLGSHELNTLFPTIAEFISSQLPDTDLQSCHILTRGDYAREIMLILVWGSDKESEKKSGIAFLLQKELKRFGMIDYSSWIGKASFEKSQFDATDFEDRSREKKPA